MSFRAPDQKGGGCRGIFASWQDFSTRWRPVKMTEYDRKETSMSQNKVIKIQGARVHNLKN
ncbi:MAG: hypothetical protein IIV26_07955, partial [Peptococcaceae bacterium]|nr:hypothetical protein [Peptococcaceae bacterium]